VFVLVVIEVRAQMLDVEARLRDRMVTQNQLLQASFPGNQDKLSF